MEKTLLLGVDVGSTSVKCVAVSPDGAIAASSTGAYPLDSPNPGWVEQKAEHWWRAALGAIRHCVSLAGGKNMAAISFSGHMSAMVLLDGRNRPVRPSMLVADNRSQPQVQWLKDRYGSAILESTGNIPVAAFVAPRLLWLKEHDPEALDAAQCFLFPKDYIRFRLTGRLETEPTDAGNTLLYDIAAQDWNYKLIRELKLNEEMFPPLRRTAEPVGRLSREASALTGLPEGIPIVAGGADMACSQLGTGAIKEGRIAVTLSTSIQVTVPLRRPTSKLAGAFTFHPSASEGAVYAMGSLFNGGLGVDWGMKLLMSSGAGRAAKKTKLERWTKEMESESPGSGGLLFLPFLVGSGTPRFDSNDRGTWLGLSIGQSKPQLLHSVLEGITYSIRENMEWLALEGSTTQQLVVGGGGSRNPVWRRLIANICARSVAVLENRDASALGAAMLAGIGAGIYRSPEDAAAQAVRIAEEIEPDSGTIGEYDRLYAQYKEAYRALNQFYRDRSN
ncbi:xylulokinase [Cohnella fermenti]|uniref:Xylulokinase n=1 Tax=Cohnella fermenti TaxID=2565925 RepID=A0A4S4BH82_9BACL|nr:FGGY family carbohydrate kinase [Cohnella fermenti]THF73835.1 hypothetical protein E6C55_27335 [Cohnella fermenti]